MIDKLFCCFVFYIWATKKEAFFTAYENIPETILPESKLYVKALFHLPIFHNKNPAEVTMNWTYLAIVKSVLVK